MPEYKVHSPIRTGGKLYKVGEVVALSEQLAAPLVARKRLSPVQAQEKPVAASASSPSDSRVAASQTAAGDAHGATEAKAGPLVELEVVVAPEPESKPGDVELELQVGSDPADERPARKPKPKKSEPKKP